MILDFSGWASIAHIPVRMTYREFEKARRDWGEYSSTIPTGTTPGKRWLRRTPYHAEDMTAQWYIGEYGPIVDKDIMISWKRLEIDWSEHLLERLGKGR